MGNQPGSGELPPHTVGSNETESIEKKTPLPITGGSQPNNPTKKSSQDEWMKRHHSQRSRRRMARK